MLLLGIETATPPGRRGARLRRRHARARRARRVRRLGPAPSRGDSSRPRSSTAATRSATSLDHVSAIAVGIGPGMFTGLRVGVTTAKVLAQALRVPMIPIPSLDLLAYPLRHARGLVVGAIDARRSEIYYALVPRGAGRRAAGVGVRGGLGRGSRRPSWRLAARKPCCAATAPCAYAEVFARRRAGASSRVPRTRHPSLAALAELAIGRYEREEFCTADDVLPLYLPQERRRARVGPQGAVTVATARKLVEPLEVHVGPMRRRHLRSVLRIEAQVYPTPWSHVAVRERARAALDAGVRRRAGRTRGRRLRGPHDVVNDGHITTIAVDPEVAAARRSATRLLLALAREAIARGANALTLEVRLSNRGAQGLYQRFGFTAVGVRKGYYADSGEDALIMWAHDVDQPDVRRAARPASNGAWRAPRCSSVRRDGDGAHPRSSRPRATRPRPRSSTTAASCASSVVVEPGRPARALRRRRSRDREPRPRRARQRRDRARRWSRPAPRSTRSTRSRPCHGPGLAGALLVGVSAAKAIALATDVPVRRRATITRRTSTRRCSRTRRSSRRSLTLSCRAATRCSSRWTATGATGCSARPSTTRPARRSTRSRASSGSAIRAVPRSTGSRRPATADAIAFPRPMLDDGDDFSFSGLKTAVVQYVRKHPDVDGAPTSRRRSRPRWSTCS